MRIEKCWTLLGEILKFSTGLFLWKSRVLLVVFDLKDMATYWFQTKYPPSHFFSRKKASNYLSQNYFLTLIIKIREHLLTWKLPLKDPDLGMCLGPLSPHLKATAGTPPAPGSPWWRTASCPSTHTPFRSLQKGTCAPKVIKRNSVFKILWNWSEVSGMWNVFQLFTKANRLMKNKKLGGSDHVNNKCCKGRELVSPIWAVCPISISL